MVRKDDVFGDGTWRAREGDAESRTGAFYHLFPGIGRFLSHSVLALHTGVSGALHQGSSWRAGNIIITKGTASAKEGGLSGTADGGRQLRLLHSLDSNRSGAMVEFFDIFFSQQRS